jgi:hypothetical protein
MVGQISEKSVISIRDSLPSLPDDWLDITFPEQLSFRINDLDKNETTHISLVCLYDAFRRAESVLECLFQSYAHIIWYRKEKKDIKSESREVFAVKHGKFYAEYNFLFLYAIGEDIADFILNFLTKEKEFNIWQKSPSVQKKINKKKVTSKAAKVGVFMADEYPRHKITKIILKLRDDNFWNEAMKYRNNWVHQKPPIVEGLGLEYNRNNKIFIENGKKGFGIGTWSKPDYKVDDVVKIAHEATNLCIKVLSDLLETLKEKKEELETSTV